MPSPIHIRAIRPWRGRNPFSSTFRRLFNEALEIVYRFAGMEEELSRVISERYPPPQSGTSAADPTFRARITGAVAINEARWRYRARRVRPRFNSFGASAPFYEDAVDDEGNTFDFDAWNRAEEWNTGDGERISYGIKGLDVDNKDDFCVRPLPIGDSDDSGVPPAPPPDGAPISPNVVVDIRVEQAIRPGAPGEEDTFEPTFWFSAGTEVDVECCPPCDSFPMTECPQDPEPPEPPL